MRCAFFFFNDTATTEIYTLSLHDALPIFPGGVVRVGVVAAAEAPSKTMAAITARAAESCADRKSTRLNSSHANISYAVFCLKKKKLPRSALTTKCQSGAYMSVNAGHATDP